MAFAHRLAYGLLPCALGCNDLPRVPASVCGNGVTEAPEEECDTFAPEGQRCRAPGPVDECRFECTPGDDEAKCPADSACGLDGICRFFTGIYEPWGGFLPVVAASIELGDFDGDGRQDLLALGNTNLLGQSMPRIYFFDESGRAKEPFNPQTPVRSPVITAYGSQSSAEDRRQRIVFATDFGIAALEATDTRTVLPIAYPYQVVPDDWLYRVLRIKGNSASVLGDGILLITSVRDPEQTVFQPAESDEFPGPLAALPESLDRFAGDVLAGNVIEGSDSPCEEAVLARSGEATVRLLELCDSAGNWHTATGGLEVVVELPEGHTIGQSMLLTRVDTDEHLDLLVADQDGAAYLAFGRGDGTFVADPANPDATLGGAWPVTIATGDCLGSLPPDLGFPLAIGDLNADDVPDWVTAVGVTIAAPLLVNEADRQVALEACPGNAPFVGKWSQASIADLNGDGRPDLVAGSSSAPDLDFYAGTGLDRMNRVGIATEGPISHMVVADFDGDLIEDVALGLRAQQADAADDAGIDKAAITFGSRDDDPSAPVEVGQFSTIEQLISANYQTNDAIAELGVIGRSDAYDGEGLTVFVGNPGQHPIASLGLIHIATDDSSTTETSADDRTASQTPIACAVGQFSGNGSLSLVALGLENEPNSTSSPRFWYAEGSDLARLSKPVPSAGLPDELRAWQTDPEIPPVLLAGDVDRRDDRADEALVLALTKDKNPLGLWRVNLPKDGADWPAKAATRLSTGPGRLVRASHPTLVDMDEDGWLDLVLIVADADGKQQLGIVWNEKGDLDLSEIKCVPLGGESVLGFASASDGRVTRWAAVTDDETSLIPTGSAARRLVTTCSAARSPGSALDSIAPGGRAVGLGDLTGDGLMDLVIADQSGVRLFVEKPTKP